MENRTPGRLAQLVRAPALQAGGPRFESVTAHHSTTQGSFPQFTEENHPMSGFEQFIQERIYLRNVSPRTVDWYHQTFKCLEKYPLTEEGLKQLVIAMREAGLQAISCNSRIRCINAYLKWGGLLLSIPKLREESKVHGTLSASGIQTCYRKARRFGAARGETAGVGGRQVAIGLAEVAAKPRGHWIVSVIA